MAKTGNLHRIARRFVIQAALVLLVPVVASASTLLDSMTLRLGFTPQASINNNSYDGPLFDAFSPFSAFVAPELYQINSFTGHPTGSTLEFTLLSNAAFFDGHAVAGLGDNFGVLSNTNVFTSVLNSTVVSVGASASIQQAAGEELTLALLSPVSLFSSIDANNADSSAHLLGLKVVQNGQVTLSNMALYNHAPFTVNLLAGDVLLFWEDLLSYPTLAPYLGVMTSDFDFNDFVVIVRQTPNQQVPEPATVLLLGGGLASLLRSRRRSLKQKI